MRLTAWISMAIFSPRRITGATLLRSTQSARSRLLSNELGNYPQILRITQIRKILSHKKAQKAQTGRPTNTEESGDVFVPLVPFCGWFLFAKKRSNFLFF